MDPIYLNLPETDLVLILQRRKNRIKCLFEPKGTNQIFTFRDFAFSLPSRVKVGLGASRTSRPSPSPPISRTSPCSATPRSSMRS